MVELNSKNTILKINQFNLSINSLAVSFLIALCLSVIIF